MECFDGYSNECFILHAFTMFWSGDIPAISKLAGFTGHNSYHGCRFCMIRGKYCSYTRHIYYPPAENEDNSLRTHEQTLDLLEKLEATEDTKHIYNRLTQNSGKHCMSLFN